MVSYGSMYRVLVLLMAVMLIAGCGDVEQHKAKYMAKGKVYLEQQNYDKARIEFKNVLQIDPKYSEAYYLIGQVEEKKENWEQAFGNYSKAVEFNPDHLGARGRLARLYLLSGDTDNATKMADAILVKQPESVTGKAIRIGIIARKGDVKGAIQKAEELVAAYPSESEAIDLLAALYLESGNTDKAVNLLKKGIVSSPKNIEFHATLAKIYAGKKEYEKAEQAMLAIIGIEPDKLPHRMILASFYSQTNQLDKSEQTLRDAIQADTRDMDRYLLLADFLAEHRGPSQAEMELQNAIKAYPKSYRLRFGLASLYEKAETNGKAMAVYRDIIDSDGTGLDGLNARNKLSEILLRQGQQAEPEKLAQEVLETNPHDNEALIIHGKLAMLKGNAQEAISSFRSVLKDQPASLDVLALLADAHVMNKDFGLARENLSRAVELNPQNPKARLPLAQFLVRMGDYDGALKKIDEALRIAPKNLELLLAKAEILSAKKDTKGMQAALMKVKEAHPENPIGYYRLGEYFLMQKKYDDAIREFEQAMKKGGEGFQVLSAIIGAYNTQGKPERAISRLKSILEEKPSHPFAHELLAEVYITKKQYPDAEKELLEAVKADPKWNVPYRNLANLYLVRGEFPKAEEIYKRGLQAMPEDAELLLHLAQSYEATRDAYKAIITYEQLLQKYPSFEMAANNLASLLADRKGDASSLKRAKALAQHFETSPQPAFRDTLGWVYYKSGETDKAVTMLKEVVKQAPAIPIFRYHLGMAYLKQGNVVEAKANLAKAVEAKQDFPGLDEAQAAMKRIQ